MYAYMWTSMSVWMGGCRQNCMYVCICMYGHTFLLWIYSFILCGGVNYKEVLKISGFVIELAEFEVELASLYLGDIKLVFIVTMGSHFIPRVSLRSSFKLGCLPNNY